ncbi:MAG: 30S ribosomal protein S6 [Candidatus Pacebacteria bacterium]|nr:30S ribosomal protein S6 [Candidatus Paceibacterota bacterium]
MKQYQLNYLILPDLNEEDAKSLQERINSFVVENQGTLDKIFDIAKKRIDQRVKKQDVAYLASLDFHFLPEKIMDLEKKLKSEEKIIRYAILNKKAQKPLEAKRRRPILKAAEETAKATEKPKKVEIKEIEKKLEEILGE